MFFQDLWGNFVFFINDKYIQTVFFSLGKVLEPSNVIIMLESVKLFFYLKVKSYMLGGCQIF